MTNEMKSEWEIHTTCGTVVKQYSYEGGKYISIENNEMNKQKVFHIPNFCLTKSEVKELLDLFGLRRFETEMELIQEQHETKAKAL